MELCEVAMKGNFLHLPSQAVSHQNGLFRLYKFDFLGKGSGCFTKKGAYSVTEKLIILIVLVAHNSSSDTVQLTSPQLLLQG